MHTTDIDRLLCINEKKRERAHPAFHAPPPRQTSYRPTSLHTSFLFLVHCAWIRGAQEGKRREGGGGGWRGGRLNRTVFLPLLCLCRLISIASITPLKLVDFKPKLRPRLCYIYANRPASYTKYPKYDTTQFSPPRVHPSPVALAERLSSALLYSKVSSASASISECTGLRQAMPRPGARRDYVLVIMRDARRHAVVPVTHSQAVQCRSSRVSSRRFYEYSYSI